MGKKKNVSGTGPGGGGKVYLPFCDEEQYTTCVIEKEDLGERGASAQL